MAKIINLLFDGLLVKEKIVFNRDFNLVHAWMDELYALYQSERINFNIDVDEVKLLILAKTSEIDDVVLTDYFRVALGHFLLAALSNGFAFDSDYVLIRTAFQQYLDRGFNKFYVSRAIIGNLVK